MSSYVIARCFFWLLPILLASMPVVAEDKTDSKTVLLAILARNKAHVLPRYLKCIDNLEYDKKLITVYINTNNNDDATKELLEEWKERNNSKYREIVFENHDVQEMPDEKPHDWSTRRFKILGAIRNKSLQKTLEYACDFYFTADCDNFIAPFTLRELISKDKPIISPMLRSIPEPNDIYANFFCAVAENGYWKDSPDFMEILTRKKLGTFKVPVVHCAYLIKAKYIDKLNYIDDSDSHEFIILCRTARKNNVDQYICNEKEFGVQIHIHANLSLEEEKRRMESILTMP